MSRRKISDGSPENDLGNPGGDDNLGGLGRRDLHLLRQPIWFGSHRIKKMELFSDFCFRLFLDPQSATPQSRSEIPRGAPVWELRYHLTCHKSVISLW